MMAKKIKIAVPTDDGLSIGQQFRCSRGFLVATVKEGKIVHEEMRWNLLSEIMTSEYGFFYNLVDCDIVIVNEIGNGQLELLHAIKVESVQTDQTEILKAFSTYLDKLPRSVELIPIA